MPWKTNEEIGARRCFIAERLTLGAAVKMTALCREHGISRESGYKWWRRFRAGGDSALRSQPRVTGKSKALAQCWLPRLLQAKRQQRNFGPKKLRWLLRQSYPRGRLPGWRTLARWLARTGQVRRRRPSAMAGALIRLPGRLCGRCCNDVWTIDFKGRFRARDGRWVQALTVRDQASGFLLEVRHLPRPSERWISPVLLRLFRRYGLPRAIRMDNGQPFGAIGPRGWSRLNLQWLKLGIRLEHGRPGCPQDNAAHEQMHRMLKEQATRPASVNPPAQQRRFDRWRHHYNHHRPHERLDMVVPASCYRPSPRRLSATIVPWTYPATWQRLQTDAKGRWRWRGRCHHLGRAFVGEQLAARALASDRLAIYLGPHLLGHLHAHDPGTIRLVRRNSPTKSGRGCRPSRTLPDLPQILPTNPSKVSAM
jgi:putative transposase